MAIQDLLNKMSTSVGGSDTASTQDEEDFEDLFYDEEDDLLDEDPQPQRLVDAGIEKPKSVKSVVAKAIVKKLTKAEEKQIREALGMLFGLPVIALSLAKDHHCANAIDENQEEVINRLLPIITKNPGLKKYLLAAESAGNVMDYAFLIYAMSPMVQSISQHHDLGRLNPLKQLRNINKKNKENEDETTYNDPFQSPNFR